MRQAGEGGEEGVEILLVALSLERTVLELLMLCMGVMEAYAVGLEGRSNRRGWLRWDDEE